MVATDYEHEDVLLLALEADGLLMPINKAAFHVGQTTRKNLRTRYKNALVISRRGVVRRIETVEIIGLWGDTLPRKLLSLLTSAWAIQVNFGSPLSISLDELKSKIVGYLQKDQASADPYFSLAGTLEQTIDSIRGAVLFSEVFDSLNVPPANDCLDVL